MIELKKIFQSQIEETSITTEESIQRILQNNSSDLE
jgi:hypothetical protein